MTHSRPIETPPEYQDDRGLSAHTPLSRVYWQKLRQDGKGPPWLLVGRRCIYRWSDVVAWLEAQRTSEVAQ